MDVVEVFGYLMSHGKRSHFDVDNVVEVSVIFEKNTQLLPGLEKEIAIPSSTLMAVADESE